MAPSKTPEPIIRKLSELLLKLVDDPEVKEDHAQHWRQYGRDHARAVPRADRAGNCAVEAVDPGDRGVEIAAVDLRACRISAIAGCSNMTRCQLVFARTMGTIIPGCFPKWNLPCFPIPQCALREK